MIANYFLNFQSFRKTFALVEQLFYGLINIFYLKKVHTFRYFFDKYLNYSYQLFDNNGIIKSWSSRLKKNSNFKWQQLTYILPLFWKKNKNKKTPRWSWQFITSKSPPYTLTGIEKLNSWELYSPCLHPSLYTNISKVF